MKNIATCFLILAGLFSLLILSGCSGGGNEVRYTQIYHSCGWWGHGHFGGPHWGGFHGWRGHR